MRNVQDTETEEIDVAGWSKAHGQRLKPSQGRFRILVDEQDFVVDDPIVTGQQLLELIGKYPTDEFLIFQRLANGQLEEIRPDESVDLRTPLVETFHTFRSDRSFRFSLDGRKFEWGLGFITGRKLKELAGVDLGSFGVWQEMRETEDKPIGDNDQADLTGAGVERFFTGKKTTTEG